MKSDLPTGDDRYYPLSNAYYGYFRRVDTRKGKRKVKETSSPPLVTGEPVKKVGKVKNKHLTLRSHKAKTLEKNLFSDSY